jgi:hypothetical protein
MSNNFLPAVASGCYHYHHYESSSVVDVDCWQCYGTARALGGVNMRKARAVSHHFTLHLHMQRRYGNARYGSVQTGLKRSTSLSPPHIIIGLGPQVNTSNPHAFGAAHLNRYHSTDIHPPWPITSPHCHCH